MELLSPPQRCPLLKRKKKKKRDDEDDVDIEIYSINKYKYVKEDKEGDMILGQ